MDRYIDMESEILNRDCYPVKSSATKWSSWKATEKEADTEAQTKAREASGNACHGKCKETSCVYFEESSELLKTEERQNNSDQTEYRSQAKSTGTCDCKKE